MSKISGRANLAAILATVAVTLSIGAGTAFAGDNNVTEDQILKALAPPPPKALTRGLSVGPQADPAKVAEEGAFVQKIRNRATRSLSSGEREEIATIAKNQAEHRSGNQLRLQFGRHQRQIDAVGSGAGQGADQS